VTKWMPAVLAPAVLLIGGVSAGCGYARLDRSWKSPEFHGPAFRKVLVVCVAPDSEFRLACEEALVGQLQARGVVGVAGTALAGELRTADEAAIGEGVTQTGADAVLLARWVKVERRPIEIPPEPGVWVRIQSAWPGTCKPVIGGYVDVVTLGIRLLSAATMQSVWSGTTETFVANNLQQAVGDLARTVTNELARRKLL
jgi:hypothetical protein